MPWTEPMTLDEFRARSDRRSRALVTFALLLLYLASLWFAYDAGRTDHAKMIARDAEDRAWEASVR